MAKRDDTLIWILLAGAGAAAAFAGRKQIAAGAGMVFDEARFQIFRAIISSNARQYAEIIWSVAEDEGVSPFVIAAIGERESRWGSALRPPGPAGTGDFVARRGAWLDAPNTIVVDSLPSGWSSGGQPGPWAIPADQQGWGKGVLQLDLNNATSVDWRDPEANVRGGVRLLKQKARYINSKVPGLSADDLMKASVTAYNRGEGGVVKALLAGTNPDAGSAGGNYGSDVISRAIAFAQAFVASGGSLT